MKDKISILLDGMIEEELNNVKTLQPGTKEKTDAIEDLNQLYKLRIEEAKIEQERAHNNRDIELRRVQLESQAKDRRVNVGLQIGLSMASLVAYDLWYRRGLKFEETGVIRSRWIRNLVSRMFPKK